MKANNVVGAVIASLILAALPVTAIAQPRISVRLEFGAPPVDRYYVSLGDEYNVPYSDICVMHDAGVVDEDMPLILYIYTHSQYSLRQIYSLRLRGATWENLSNWCGVPLYNYHAGPPYGKAYGYYSHGPGRFDGDGRGHSGNRSKGERGEVRFRREH